MTRKHLVWLILALPAVPLALSSYGYALSRTGILSAVLILVTLAAPYLRRVLPGAMCHRRAIGVAGFGYAALHLAIYLSRKWEEALPAALGPDLLTGWVAFAVFAALALTSTNRAVRAMGPRWRRLHRFTWPASALVAAHWWLTAFDPVPAIAFTAALGVLLALRVRRSYR